MAPNTQSEHARDGLDLLVDIRDARRRIALAMSALEDLRGNPVVDLAAINRHRRLLGAELRAAWIIARDILASCGRRG
ncbi:hypothetical protein [Variovorax soli]|uniref:hypothetical protein n=1 Tax=Variovorax soli TaxID=376815 RepID=UPI000838B43A|nr:hypothetical protein [Variovorax soli]